MAYPRTSAEIRARLDTVYDQIVVIQASVSKFAKTINGTVLVDPNDQYNALIAELERLEGRLNNGPWIRGSTPFEVT